MQIWSVDRLVGQILGKYRVERLLGSGRLNAVYMARHLVRKERMALTLYLVPDKLSPDARTRFLQRFRNEADALTTLRHPHILPVYDYGQYAEHPYLVTPYMMKGSLADSLKQQRRCQPEYVLDILVQVVAGLAFAHSNRVIHGTLKPSNIVLGENGAMQVAGFGLMHILQMRGVERNEQPYGHLLSIANTFLVAPEYVAPEVVQGQSIDARSDIYALGIILFELLSGQPPFVGADPLEVVKQHVQQAVPSLRTVCPDIPLALAAVVNQALDPDVRRRFQFVEELAEAFAQASRGAKASQAGAAVVTARNNAPGQENIAGSWQLTPPIITSKLPAVTATNDIPAAPSIQSFPGASAKGEYWQFVQPEPPAIPPSAHREPPAAQESVFPAMPLSMPPPSSSSSASLASQGSIIRADDWWVHELEEAPQSVRTEPLKKNTGPVRSSPRRSRAARGRPGSKSRRTVIAVLATGGVLAAGAALVTIDRNLIQMVQEILQPPPIAPNGTTPAVAQDQGGQGNNQPPAQQAGVIGSTQQPVNSATDFENPANKQASLLIRLPDGNFVAYEKACTHRGVNVQYNADTQTLICPAHNAVFDATNDATVLQGPAPSPQPKVQIKVNDDGTITIA